MVFHRVIFCSFLAYSHVRRLLQSCLQCKLCCLCSLCYHYCQRERVFLYSATNWSRLKTLQEEFRTPGNPQMFRLISPHWTQNDCFYVTTASWARASPLLRNLRHIRICMGNHGYCSCNLRMWRFYSYRLTITYPGLGSKDFRSTSGPQKNGRC